MSTKNILLFFSLLLNLVLIGFLLKTYHYIRQEEKKQKIAHNEILRTLDWERAGVNPGEMYELCLGKVVVAFPEGMCVSCFDRVFQRISDLKESQKENLLIVIPTSLRREFEMYNESVYHFPHVGYSSDFLNFVATEPILFYMSDTGNMIMPVSLNYYPQGIEQFFSSIFHE